MFINKLNYFSLKGAKWIHDNDMIDQKTDAENREDKLEELPTKNTVTPGEQLEDFDFEKANEEFMELMKNPDESKTAPNGLSTKHYNKKHSFFDDLQTDEKPNPQTRYDRDAELKRNKETFGC